MRTTGSGRRGGGRRLILAVIAGAAAASCAVAAIGLAAGPARTSQAMVMPAAHVHARTPSALTALDRRYRGLLASARCGPARAQVARAARLRARALRGARSAGPASLRRRRADLTRAVAILRAADRRCAATRRVVPAPVTTAPSPAPPGAPPVAGAPTPPPITTPAEPTTPTTPTTPTAPTTPPQAISLHSAAGTMLMFTETSLTASPGTITIALTNGSSITHGLGVRQGSTVLGTAASTAPAGGTTSVTVTLGPGAYQVYCTVDGHAALGMVVPLTVG
jgi:plastocyanin